MPFDLVKLYKSLPLVGWDEFFDEISGNIENISSILNRLEAQGQIIGPQQKFIFNAFEYTPLHFTKVVVLGLDPYPGVDSKGVSIARGMSFSVDSKTPAPRSLKNIFKEIKNEYPEYEIPNSGDLRKWAKQGVLMLNTALTIEVGKSSSHSKMGFWESFIKPVIKKILKTNPDCIFVLWGADAYKVLEKFTDIDKLNILKSAHPSGFSANKGFFGNGHFKEINRMLNEQGKMEIEW